MLTRQKVLKYIKSHLSFPWQALEISDENIINYISDFTIENFSHFWPDENKILFTANEENKTEISNEFYIWDPDGMPILYIIECVDGAEVYTSGHPFLGTSNALSTDNWVYQVEKSGMNLRYGFQTWSYEFIHPNILRLHGQYSSQLSIRYARVHNPDFHTINIHQQKYFLPYALAEIKIWLGGLRKKYQNLTTPYGDIPISADIYDEGKSEKQDIEDKLRMRVASVVISIG